MFSVTSEESFTLSTPGMLVAQLSKSPSAEFITEATEEHKAQMFMQESVFAHLSIEEKECILNVPAAKHLDDLQMFVRYSECSKISNTSCFCSQMKLAATCDFQQCGILTSVDSDVPVQPPLKLRNSK